MENISNVFGVIRYRRSVREYSNKPIEKWKLDLILESARLAPSSTNSQPWRIIVVTEEKSKKMLAGATPAKIKRHHWLMDCPAVLILCSARTILQRAGKLVRKDYSRMDIGIAGEHICLVAAELGLGSCWLGWIVEGSIKKYFEIPDIWEVECLISLGYPLNPHPEKTITEELIPKLSTIVPLQQKGEIGIGYIEAKKRYSSEKIIFHEKVDSKSKKSLSLY